MVIFVFSINYGKLLSLRKIRGTMKKLLLLLISLLVLTSCQGKISSPHTIETQEDSTGYIYTISGDEKEYILRIPTLKSTDEQLSSVIGPVYSLNPKTENKNNLAVSQSTFYKNDDVDTYTKDRVYNTAYYGHGFWVLNDSGNTKVNNQNLLNKNDYTLLFGDYYHNTDFNNLDYINYYLATQELIWESITNPATGSNFQIEFKDLDLSFEKTKITEAQNDYSRSPFFGGSVINVDDERLAANQPFELTDQNGILNRFEVKATNGIEILPSQEPNKLNFTIKEVTRNSKINFLFPYKIKQEISYVYSSDENISYLSIGQDRSIALSSSLYIEHENLNNGITLAVRTYDEDSKLEIFGAQYNVSTGPEFLEPSTTTVSDENIPALLDNLVPGTYYVQQTQAPEGYALNQEVETITIKSGILEMTYPFYNIKK